MITSPTSENILPARQLLEEAIALDPKYSDAYRFLSLFHYMNVLMGLSNSPQDSLETAMEMVQKAIKLDDSNAAAYSALGLILVMKREYDEAIGAVERAYELEPNSTAVLAHYAAVLESMGRTQEAIQMCEKTMRLAPIYPWIFLSNYATALRSAGRYDEAIAFLKRAIEQEPNAIHLHVSLTQCYWLSGRKEKARAEAAEVLRLNLKFSAEIYVTTLPYKDRARLQIHLDVMREAGLPD